MPKPAQLQKAQLIEMAPDLTNTADGAEPVNVQFNPESLKVTYANQVATAENKNAQTGTVALQHVGQGSTKLAVQLWFDINHPAIGDATPTDVRDLTSQVTYFITPKDDNKTPKTYLIPAVRFHWGAFSFVGVMESLEESLELFSSDGRPTRASISFGLTQQSIIAFEPASKSRLPATGGPSGRKPAGTAPMTPAAAGSSVQSLADRAGPDGTAWQDIAAANGVENPRFLVPGELLNLNAQLPSF